MMLSDVYLSDVCLSHTSGISRVERPGKTKFGTQVAHITRDSDTTSKVKRSKVNLFDGLPGLRLRPYSAWLCFALTVSAHTW